MRLRLFTTLAVLAITGGSAALSPLSPVGLLPHWYTLDGLSHHFQGTTSTGEPIADGPHTLMYSIWDDPTAGVMLWSEVQTVNTVNGLGAVELGVVTPIPLSAFGQIGDDTTKSRYLEVQLDGETISPRERLIAAPYAHAAERILGDLETGPGDLRIRNIGSSGEDGVRLTAYLGTFQTEMVSLSLTGSSPVIVQSTSTQTDSAKAKVGHTNPSGESNSSTTSASDGTIQTELVSLSLSGSSPIVVQSASSQTDSAKVKVGHTNPGGESNSSTTSASDGTIQTELVSLSLTGSAPIVVQSASSQTDTAKTRVGHTSPTGNEHSATTSATDGEIRTELVSLSLSGSAVVIGDLSRPGGAQRSLEYNNPGSGVLSAGTQGATADSAFRQLLYSTPSIDVQVGERLSMPGYGSDLRVFDGSSTGESNEAVDARDYALWRSNYGTTGSATDSSHTTTDGDLSSSNELQTLSSSGHSVRVITRASDADGGRLSVSNIGSSGLDGVSIDLSAAENGGVPDAGRGGGLTVSNIGSSGQDGVSISLGTTTDLSTPSSPVRGGHLVVSNIGSSGEDGVSFEVNPDSSRFRMGRLTPKPVIPGVQTAVALGSNAHSTSFWTNPADTTGGFYRVHMSFDTASLTVGESDDNSIDPVAGGGGGGRVIIRVTPIDGELSLRNIGSSGNDGFKTLMGLATTSSEWQEPGGAGGGGRVYLRCESSSS
ncbi:MAG TPA: hypothetical protein VLB27_03450, partial [candidate division Zixibacteria bacterium]|nr:hypothetical protein [candidate division Zixibacteria bacterium]